MCLIVVGALPPSVFCFLFFKTPARHPEAARPPHSALTERSKTLGPAPTASARVCARHPQGDGPPVRRGAFLTQPRHAALC